MRNKTKLTGIPYYLNRFFRLIDLYMHKIRKKQIDRINNYRNYHIWMVKVVTQMMNEDSISNEEKLVFFRLNEQYIFCLRILSILHTIVLVRLFFILFDYIVFHTTHIWDAVLILLYLSFKYLEHYMENKRDKIINRYESIMQKKNRFKIYFIF